MNILSRGWPRSSSPRNTKGKQSDLAHWYFEARLPHSVVFHTRVFRPPLLPSSPNTRLHIVLIISPIRHLSSTLDRVPALRAHVVCSSRWPLLSFLHMRIHLPSLFLSFLHRFISANVTVARTRGSETSIVQKRGRTIYSVICGFAHCCRNHTI